MSSDTGFPTGDGGAIGNQCATIKTSAAMETKQAEVLPTSGGPPALDNATKLIHEFLMKEPEFERVYLLQRAYKISLPYTYILATQTDIL
jgi:hypothetical protein